MSDFFGHCPSFVIYEKLPERWAMPKSTSSVRFVNEADTEITNAHKNDKESCADVCVTMAGRRNRFQPRSQIIKKRCESRRTQRRNEKRNFCRGWKILKSVQDCGFAPRQSSQRHANAPNLRLCCVEAFEVRPIKEIAL